MSPTLFDAALLDTLCDAARSAARRRAHHTLHSVPAQPCQRMLVPIEPDSYVPPHRHLDPAKAEALIVLRGALGVLWFDATGRLAGTAVLQAAGAPGIDIPAGLFHSVLALAPATIFFETKAGPWLPLQVGEQGRFAPREGEPGVAAYLAGMRACFPEFVIDA